MAKRGLKEQVRMRTRTLRWLLGGHLLSHRAVPGCPCQQPRPHFCTSCTPGRCLAQADRFALLVAKVDACPLTHGHPCLVADWVPCSLTTVCPVRQDLSKLNASELTPLSPEVISRQATINIGAPPALRCRGAARPGARGR